MSIPRGYCQCGCGQKTAIAKMTLNSRGQVKGQPLRYLSGHNCGAIDLRHKTFNRLTAVEPVGRDPKGGIQWRCVCSCGKETVVLATLLRNNKIKSCGCLMLDRTRETNTKHGRSGNRLRAPRLYHIWLGMKQRCHNPKSKDCSNYGGRGITVCQAWRDDYMAFHRWAMANGYEDHLTIDRVNNDGNYEPDNCRWATHSEQNFNRRPKARGAVSCAH